MTKCLFSTKVSKQCIYMIQLFVLLFYFDVWVKFYLTWSILLYDFTVSQSNKIDVLFPMKIRIKHHIYWTDLRRFVSKSHILNWFVSKLQIVTYNDPMVLTNGSMKNGK